MLLSCLVFSYLSRTLPLVTPPAKPVLLANQQVSFGELPSELSTGSWGINFPAPLASRFGRSADGVEVYQARFGHRQTRGELINWNNQLFNPKLWTVVEQQPLQLASGSAMQLQLKTATGQSRIVLYWYQVGDYFGPQPLRVKLAQLQQLLLRSGETADVVAVSLLLDQPGLTNADAALQLQQFATQLQISCQTTAVCAKVQD